MLLQVAALPVLGREHEVQVAEEIVYVVGVLVHARCALGAEQHRLVLAVRKLPAVLAVLVCGAGHPQAAGRVSPFVLQCPVFRHRIATAASSGMSFRFTAYVRLTGLPFQVSPAAVVFSGRFRSESS